MEHDALAGTSAGTVMCVCGYSAAKLCRRAGIYAKDTILFGPILSHQTLCGNWSVIKSARGAANVGDCQATGKLVPYVHLQKFKDSLMRDTGHLNQKDPQDLSNRPDMAYGSCYDRIIISWRNLTVYLGATSLHQVFVHAWLQAYNWLNAQN